METLETTSEKVAPIKEEVRDYLATKKISYEGLKKVEEGVYLGPTGIKYWM